MVLPRALSLGAHLAIVLQLLLLRQFSVIVPVCAAHACEAEASSACPDRPGSEMARCLKDKSEHEAPTSISSECTDFIALNIACEKDLAKFCDSAFFSDDTVLCLTEWTDQHSLSPTCSGVMKWALPHKEDDGGPGPTDELGLSEQDYADKRAWQAQRKAERGAAIEKMREQKADSLEAQELEALKKENPAEYQQKLAEREEAKRSFEELKKRKRLLAAAEERTRRKEAGLPEIDDVEKEKTSSSGVKSTKRVKKKKLSTWETIVNHDYFLPGALGIFALLVFGAPLLISLFSKDKDDKDD